MFESKKSKVVLIGFISVLAVLNLYKFLFASEALEADIANSRELQNTFKRNTNADSLKGRVSLAWLKSVESADIVRDLFALETYSQSLDVPAPVELKPLKSRETVQMQKERPRVEVVAVTSSSGNAKALIKYSNELFSVVKGTVIDDNYIVEKIENGKVYLKSVK